MLQRFICLISIFLMGCGNTEVDQTMPTMPVSVMALTVNNVIHERELTGVVSHYREQKIGFEVGGRVTVVLDEGLEVRGPTFNEMGKLIRQGDPIAVMEGSRFGSQVGVLQAQVNAARRDLQAVDAQVTLALQTLERQQTILQKQAGSQQAVDDAKSQYDQSIAAREARRASVVAAEKQLDKATKDLGDAVLYAPFSGRITKAHITDGAVVSPGEPVVTLTLMDPMQIEVEVSADLERNIETGDRAVVYPKDPFNPDVRVPVHAVVYEKSAVADPHLRTFRIVLMARNDRYHVYERDESLSGFPVVNKYLPAVREYQGEPGPLFVPINALFKEKGRHYVLKLPGVSLNKAAQRSAVGKHIPEKIRIKLSSSYTTVVQWNFRSVIEDGHLSEGDILILNPQSNYVDGVVIGRPLWLLRPRDIVPAQFNFPATQDGFYVPNHSIILLNEQPHIYRVENNTAIATAVSLHESIDDYRRISNDQLQAGAQVVIDGVHYLTNSQPVTVVEVD